MNENYFANHAIKKTVYYFNENNKQTFGIEKLNRSRFEENGENLTICLLSLNRVKLTIKLLSSIEYYFNNFQGRILIIDNASSVDQLDQLKEFVETSSLQISIHELAENQGVGRARNIAASIIETDWIMFLDNDMYFVNNPLRSIQKTLYDLGCHFLNLPLINYDNKTAFALGGALFPYVWNEGSFLGAGSCFNFKRKVETSDIKLESPFFSDFLFGGASIVNRKTFLNQGGFDYDMFVGFEDVDFSLRIYNNGFKVGNVPGFFLVHNHKPSENVDDIKAEKKRFASDVIKKSADAFYRKNGISVYDDSTEEWLKIRENELNISEENKVNKVKTNILKAKPRVALVVDIKDWAFHNISKNIVKELSSKYEFDIYFHADYSYEKWLDLYPILFKKKHDIILVFWRPILKHLFSLDLKNYLEYKFNISREDFQNFLNDTVILTGVYDHIFLKEDEIRENKDIFTNHVDGYFLASNLLKGIYENITDYPSPYTVIQDGVSKESFFRKPERRLSHGNQPLIVGWAGNSKWRWDDDGVDHKGFLTIIKPTIEELKKEGYNIELVYADKQEPSTHISPNKMNSFYNGIDVYVCASDIEGTPNPVLESMSCGIAVISTDVGIVTEVFGKKQSQFILKERTKQELKEKLKTLINDRDLLEQLAEENLIRIKHWTWESKCERFDEMFEYYLFKQSSKLNHFKKFPFSSSHDYVEVPHLQNETSDTPGGTLSDAEVSFYEEQLTEFKEKHDSLSFQYNEVINKFSFYEENYYELKKWYHKEYEVLPVWYKRIGHIIKALKGEKTFKSLVKK
ncbi:glycosyltransferase [Rufibacter soli]